MSNGSAGLGDDDVADLARVGTVGAGGLLDAVGIGVGGGAQQRDLGSAPAPVLQMI